MSTVRLLGIIFALVVICDTGRTESSNPDSHQDQENGNGFSFTIPIGRGNVIQFDNHVKPQSRMSLEEFFMNGNRNQQQNEAPEPAAEPNQFQVQQSSDPNSVVLVREGQFPSSGGGLVSRMLMARRLLRMRRLTRRLGVIGILPRMLGIARIGRIGRIGRLGFGRRRSSIDDLPLTLLSKRTGEGYNPRDYVFGNSGFSYQNDESADTNQRDSNKHQTQQQLRGYPASEDQYYGGQRDNNYDDGESSNIRGNDNYEDINDLKKQQEMLNSLTAEQQVLLLQQLQKYQEQLNQLNARLNTQPKINQINGQYQQPIQNYQNNKYENSQDLNDQQLDQIRQFQSQLLKEQYQEPQKNYQNSQQENSREINDEQVEQIRQLQLQLLKEQELQQLQLTQQGQQTQQNQQTNLVTDDQGNNNININNLLQLLQLQNALNQVSGNAGDRTESSGFPLAIGKSGGSGNRGVGVGINVGIKPPAVDIQFTKPNTGFKPIPPIAPPKPKPIPQSPMSIFPKPLLNLNGRVFFGAEVGKNGKR